MNRMITPPDVYLGPEPSLFLAGGISECADWQRDLAEALAALPWVLINPRHPAFDAANPEAAAQQIGWEFRHLQRARAVSFWFPPETLCPITLYELGKLSAGSKPLFIGVDPGYQRRQDVIIQTGLLRPEVEVVNSLEALAAQLLEGLKPAS